MTNYTRGRSKEYRTCNALRKQGFDIVQRTAGSHSPFDIIAIRFSDMKIKLVQCKLGKFSENEKKKLYSENTKLNGKYEVRFKVWN